MWVLVCLHAPCDWPATRPGCSMPQLGWAQAVQKMNGWIIVIYLKSHWSGSGPLQCRQNWLHFHPETETLRLTVAPNTISERENGWMDSSRYLDCNFKIPKRKKAVWVVTHKAFNIKGQAPRGWEGCHGEALWSVHICSLTWKALFEKSTVFCFGFFLFPGGGGAEAADERRRDVLLKSSNI